MPKSHHSNKEMKKKPLLTPKEKRAAKHMKKHSNNEAPVLITTH